ncbi:MAG: putative Ig domain-containing protein [Candidatus Cryosericum sp.]
MLKILICVGLLLAGSPAIAQNYFPQLTVAAAQARSAQQCTTLSCDGTFTKWWWPVVVLTNPDGGGNLAYIKILSNGDPCFGPVVLAGCDITKTHPGAVATAGLTALEQSALVTQASVSPAFVQTGAQLAHENTQFSLTVAPFTDPRGETITYTATGLAAWMTFDPVAIKITGTVPGTTSLVTLHITGTDKSGFSVTEGIGVSVTP